MTKRAAIIGAGPVGIEMALALVESDEYNVTLIEKGTSVASNIDKWKHVALFSPMSLNMSHRGIAVLEKLSLPVPEGCAFLTGEAFVRSYVAPLSLYLNNCANFEMMLSTKVESIVRCGMSKSSMSGRAITKFRVLVSQLEADGDGAVERMMDFDIVIDASGCYDNPSYIGEGNMPAIGERKLRQENKISYYIPNGLPSTSAKDKYCVAVIGTGASAITSIKNILDIDRLESSNGEGSSRREVSVVWVTRRPVGEQPYHIAPDYPLPQWVSLAALGNRLAEHSSETGSPLEYIPAVTVAEVAEVQQGGDSAPMFRLTLRPRFSSATASDEEDIIREVDAVVANVGYRPDMTITQELQVHYCYASEGPMKLAAALLAASGGGGGDCLSQVLPGKETMRNPESRFFIVGMKSYGRGSAFLLKIGYEQVEHIVSLLNEEEW